MPGSTDGPSTGSTDSPTVNNPGTNTNPGSNTQPLQDPVTTARVGDCYTAKINGSQVDLFPVACQPGAYKLVQKYQNVSDASGCNSSLLTDFTVTYPARRVAFSLSYQFRDNDAVHAGLNACIGQSSGSESWFVFSCQPQTFKIISKFHGTT